MKPTLNRCMHCGKTWMGSDAIKLKCKECQEKENELISEVKKEAENSKEKICPVCGRDDSYVLSTFDGDVCPYCCVKFINKPERKKNVKNNTD